MSAETENKKSNSLQTLDRALELLEIMAKAQTPLSVIELSKLMKVNRTTIYAMVNSLLDGEFIEKTAVPGRYELGYKIFELGAMYRRRYPFIRTLRYHVLPILEQWSLNVYVTVYVDSGFALVIADEYPLVPSILVEGSLIPLHATASGKVLLSGLSENRLDEALEKMELEPYTHKTIVDKDAMKRTVEHVREAKSAIDDEEYVLGTSCVAVPILDSMEHVVAALSISGNSEVVIPNQERLYRDAQIAARKLWL